MGAVNPGAANPGAGKDPVVDLTSFSPVGGIAESQVTDMHCHACSKTFRAELDFSIQGNHVIECPHCGHEHYRTIVGGKITDDRWGHANDSSRATRARSVWKSSVIQAKTSTAAAFMRDAWLNRRSDR